MNHQIDKKAGDQPLAAYASQQAHAHTTKNPVNHLPFARPETHARVMPLPLLQSKVAAGFPSPADDHIEQRLDPNQYLIDQADTTFFVTIQGESMIEAGLMPGDIAVVDKGKIAVIGNIVLAIIDGEFTIKMLARDQGGNPQLLPANASGKYSPILIEDGMQFEIWGVVIGSFRRFR